LDRASWRARLVKRFGRLVRLDEPKLARAQEFFRERGGTAAFLCRFLAFLRIVIPMLIGLSSMSFARFSGFNAAGAIAAAVVYGTLGYTFGKDLPTLLHHVALVSIVVAAIGFAAVGAYLWRRRRADALGKMSRPESDG
jgi:membrane-associated protein